MDLDQVIKKIAEKINGNIVLGINALKVSALKAESENKLLKSRTLKPITSWGEP